MKPILALLAALGLVTPTFAADAEKPASDVTKY